MSVVVIALEISTPEPPRELLLMMDDDDGDDDVVIVVVVVVVVVEVVAVLGLLHQHFGLHEMGAGSVINLLFMTSILSLSLFLYPRPPYYLSFSFLTLDDQPPEVALDYQNRELSNSRLAMVGR